MKKHIGIWIDHTKSHIVSIGEKEEHLSLIESHVDSNRIPGAMRLAASSHLMDPAFEGRSQEKRKQTLHRYYQEIIKSIKDSEKVYVFGPGEAKIELEKEINKSKDFSSQLVAVEAADKMSENQISAKVKKFFKPYL
jgi:hypothetical protein